MKNEKTKLALCYDFDGTLSPGYMQNVSFLPHFGLDIGEFWKKVDSFAKLHNMDSNLAYMQMMILEARKKGTILSKQNLIDFGKDVVFFNGLDTWFERVNQYGASVGVEVEHYIISSGIEEMIIGTNIAKNFNHIFASSFFYDENGLVVGPATAVNYTNKTQHIFRINKGIFNYYENNKVNKYIPNEEKYIPFENMVYIGDGETDVPCMKIVMQQGGYSVAVFEEGNEKVEALTKELLKDKRVNFIAPANYSQGSSIEAIVQKIINKVKAQYDIYQIS